jgi:nucleoside-diphosphate-sugar epimerase
MAMKILVTGGAGYIGTTLVPLLLEHGHQVTVFDSLRFGIEPLLPLFRHPRFAFVRADVRDRQSLVEHARTADAVVHLAAVVGYPACAQAPAEATAINVEGSANLASVVGRGRPVVLASSGSCYGAVSDAVCTEDTPLRPLTLYGQTKAQAETLLLDRCDATVYRLATAFGVSPRLRLDLLVNDFVYRSVHEHRLTVYQGQHRRTFLHVCDVARAILLAVDHAGELAGRVFNVGDERHNCTKLEMCRVIQQAVPGVAVEATAAGEDPDRRDYTVSYARIRALGFESTISLAEGVRELARVVPWIARREPFGNVSP